MATSNPFDKHEPLVKLQLNIFCDLPDVEGLSSEQRFALHEALLHCPLRRL